MLILGLDTTSKAGSVALVRDGTLVEARVGNPTRSHGERLPGDLIDLLAAHAQSLSDVDVYAVCSGPGSFTGLRVGLATVQGLALVQRRPIVPVPTLDALGWAALWSGSEGSRPEGVAAWMNAHRGEVFAALYRPPGTDDNPSDADEHPPLRPILEPTVGSPEDVAAACRERRPPGIITLIGDAVATHHALLSETFGESVRLLTEVPPLAGVAARLAAHEIRRDGGVSPYAVRPVYVRRPDAVLARERRGRDLDGPSR